MTLEQRLSNLENLVFALSKRIDDILFYQSADNAGMRQGIGDATPYTETKTAYLDDTEITFDVSLSGNLSVYVVDQDGNYPNFVVARTSERITVSFDPLESITTVTISIL